jgi:hypothetical protein
MDMQGEGGVEPQYRKFLDILLTAMFGDVVTTGIGFALKSSFEADSKLQLFGNRVAPVQNTKQTCSVVVEQMTLAKSSVRYFCVLYRRDPEIAPETASQWNFWLPGKSPMAFRSSGIGCPDRLFQT